MALDAQTNPRESTERTFSTVVELMKKYPEYRFMSSQALLLKYLKEEAPEKYSEVKELVKDGKFDIEGAMWVEADCNLISGESLVRQILYGKRFFRDEFGVENHILWLPDVFGYSAALPQILRKSNVDWFVTSKISWNDTNQMPVRPFHVERDRRKRDKNVFSYGTGQAERQLHRKRRDLCRRHTSSDGSRNLEQISAEILY